MNSASTSYTSFYGRQMESVYGEPDSYANLKIELNVGKDKQYVTMGQAKRLYTDLEKILYPQVVAERERMRQEKIEKESEAKKIELEKRMKEAGVTDPNELSFIEKLKEYNVTPEQTET